MDSALRNARELLGLLCRTGRDEADRDVPVWIDDEIVFDTGVQVLVGAEEVMWWATRTGGIADLTVLEAEGTELSASLLFEFVDRVTMLRHREAWFVLTNGKSIQRVLAVSAIVPPRVASPPAHDP